MVGISADNLLWIDHLLFMVSRTQPKINLQRMIIENGDVEAKGRVVDTKHFSVWGNTISFKAGRYVTTVFIKPVIALVWLNVLHFLFSCGGCFSLLR
jgi:hypothetical protein